MRSHHDSRRAQRGRSGIVPTAVCVCIFAVVMLSASLSLAQTYSVIHSFTGGQDGGSPSTGLTIDSAGRLYGTTLTGGAAGFGTVFYLASTPSGSSVSTLHNFANGSDGAGPMARLVVGPDGSLYGSTSAGGGGSCLLVNNYHGCGTIFKLSAPRGPGAGLNWISTTLFRFSETNGSYPQGDLLFDASGNIYGTAVNGGTYGWGLIYKLSPTQGGWAQSILYQPRNNGDGQFPMGGLVFDNAGNLYGVFDGGGPHGYGAVYELARSGSGWEESTVHGFSFQGQDGAVPQGGLIKDSAGNLYGATVHAPGAGGTAFQLTPSGGSWNYDILYTFTGGINFGPADKLVRDAQGNLYGTTLADGAHGYGSVFKLTRTSGGWSYRSLHDFTGGRDGGFPQCVLTFDARGNIYGTASRGGDYSNGVIFKVTP
jgi:uncharacterized repeat protein (TIGR03803 family)